LGTAENSLRLVDVSRVGGSEQGEHSRISFHGAMPLNSEQVDNPEGAGGLSCSTEWYRLRVDDSGS